MSVLGVPLGLPWDMDDCRFAGGRYGEGDRDIDGEGVGSDLGPVAMPIPITSGSAFSCPSSNRPDSLKSSSPV